MWMIAQRVHQEAAGDAEQHGGAVHIDRQDAPCRQVHGRTAR